MGFLSDIGGFFIDPIGSSLDLIGLGAPGGGLSGVVSGGGLSGGGGSDAGTEAAQIEAQANQAAIEELRRQFGITQENIAPFLQAGTGILPQVQEGATAGGFAQGLNAALERFGSGAFQRTQDAATVGGLDANLAQIFNTDIFKSLRDERLRAVQGQLAAGGLTRSGTALTEGARVPTELGLALEQLLSGRDADLATRELGLGFGLEQELFNRQSNLAGAGQNAALGLSGFGANTSSNIANFIRDTGQARGAGIIIDQQAGAAQSQNFLNTIVGGGLIAAKLGLFSDPNLKENVKEIGKVKDLTLCQWDWIPAAMKTIVRKFPTIGFLSTEVREKYPQHVYEFCGFDVIDHPSLFNELEARNAT